MYSRQVILGKKGPSPSITIFSFALSSHAIKTPSTLFQPFQENMGTGPYPRSRGKVAGVRWPETYSVSKLDRRHEHVSLSMLSTPGVTQ